MKKTNKGYGVTNQLSQIAKARQPETRVNKFGEKIGATGLSRREQMGAAQNLSLMDMSYQRTPKKKSKPVMGSRTMYNKGGRVMYKDGGMAKAKPC